MKILLLSSSNPYKTAGVAALDIYKGFSKIESNEVKMLVKAWDNYQDKNIIPINTYSQELLHLPIRILNKLEEIFLKGKFKKKTNIDYGMEYDKKTTYYSTKKILKRINFKPDVIFVLFMYKFISYKNLYELQQTTGAKIYILLMDMVPFTGGCHYAWTCEEYTKQCGKCPAIYSNNPFDISYKKLHFKNQYIQKTDTRIIIGSDWLIEQAKKSSLFKNKPISKVYLSVDENKFFPIVNNFKLREKYGINENTFVIGFGAIGITHKRKGVQYILDAINLINTDNTDKKLLFLYAGDKTLPQEYKYPLKYIGRLQRNELPDFYRTCDLFLNASLQDVGPYMLIESLMCGTPVVSFDTGIAKEFIKNNITGILTNELSAPALADGINIMLEKTQHERNIIKQNCFEITRKIVSKEKQINEYYKLFKEDKILCQ
jgi:glycosyltransferase involved in cell wall biosynthesis